MKTTYPENFTKQLQRLLGLVNESRIQLENSVEKLSSQELKDFIKHFLIEREAIQIELVNRIVRLGGNPEDYKLGLLSGLERSWQALKAKASGSGDQEVLETCRNIDHAVLDGYDDVLQGSILEDEELKYFISSQRFVINQSFLEMDERYFSLFKKDNTIG